MNITPASRMDRITEYYFSRKLKEIGSLKVNGSDIINLNITSPHILPTKSIVHDMQQVVDLPQANTYQSYIGIDVLSKAFAASCLKNYQVSLHSKEEILSLMDYKEGTMHISIACLERSDQALILDPGYPTYASISQLLETEILHYELKEKKIISNQISIP
ncbi:MAG: aminotransferase class I/II-fold pyridoxal phosphate-dependent enzyme [Flavobacteriales bacterium]